MLNKISEKYKNDIGLLIHRWWPGCIQKYKWTYKKNFQSLFKKYRLQIIIQCNKKVVDVTFNLKDGTYKPYHKPDNKISYINIQSNHPPNIIKQLPIIIEQRRSNNSSNETIFNEAAPLYEKTRSEAGYDVKLKYSPNKKTKQKLEKGT